MEDVAEKIKELLIKSFDMKPEEVTLEANLGSDLDMDSLEIVELEVALEKEFKIDIRDGELTNKNRLGDVVKMVEGKLKQ